MAWLMPVAWLALGVAAVPLAGTVEDGAGRPVAGATVWLGDTVATNKGPEVLATAETDENGHFRLERAADLTGRGGIWSPTLWAFKPGFRVAFVEFKQNLPAADEPVRLVLGPTAGAALRVVEPDGQAVKGARLRVNQVVFKAPRPPDKLFDRLATTTGDDGRATVDGLATADIAAVDVTATGKIVQGLPVDPENGTLTLRPVGRLKVQVVADDPKALRGWTITARSRPTEPGYRGPYTTHWVRNTTGDDGRIDFPPIAEGQVIWDIKPPEGSPYLVEKPPGVMIRAGKVQEVDIPVRKGVRIEGAVREEPGGAPVAGVKVDLFPLSMGGRSFEWLVTDARGKFSDIVPPGKVRFSFSTHDMPTTHFLPPTTPHWADFEVKSGEERHEFNPPPLRKAAQARGRVVDEAGKPAAGVYVHGSWTSAEYGANPNTSQTLTDARGEFVLGSIAPGSEVRAWASAGQLAESEPVTVAVAGQSEPIVLRLKAKPTLALAGRVLGPDGRPLAGATVRVKTRPPNQVPNPGSYLAFEGSDDVRTGPDGRYQTPARLPVGQHYRVEARADGFEPSESRWVIPPDLDVPDIALRKAVGTREVAGRVVDSAGKPIPGTEVYQSGDGPRRTSARSDGDGRFRVPGVPDAPAFLFVARKGYRFLGRRVEPGDRPVEFSLRRLDEPAAAPLRPVASPVSRDEERAIARALVDEARKAPGTNSDVPDRRLLPEVVALVDPDRVVEMIENQVIAADANVLAALAVARLESDPAKALDVLVAIGDPAVAAFTSLSLYDRLGPTAPADLRRELLERTAKRAREVEGPGQSASLLARVADRWLDRGDVDRGTALVREAQAQAKKPRAEGFPDPRDDLALALARVDLAAALKLIEGRGLQEYQLATLRAGIAKRVAATDPAAARRVIDAIEEQRRPWARREACLSMAAKDLPAAQVLAAVDHDPMVEALLPAVAARARETSDPEVARALLLESAHRLQKLGEGGAEVRPSPAVALARLLPMATRVDPDRAPGYFWLAVAIRPPLSALPEPMPVMPQVRQHYLDLAELAVLLARYDRAAAEAVFAPVAARLVGLNDDYWGLGNEGPALYRAAGAFDARVARSLLDALPDDPAPPANRNVIGAGTFRHHSKAQARLALAKALAEPPALRLREPFLNMNNQGNHWLEDLDDY